MLERYEWCNFWWEEADKQDKPRVLLIGDSIVNGYWPHVNQLLKETSHVDKLTTSRAADNPALLHDISHFLHMDGFQYSVIWFNNGLHGMHLSAADYEGYILGILNSIQGLATQAKLILALSTPVTVTDHPDTILEATNNIVIERNHVLRGLGAKLSLPVIDLYAIAWGKAQYRSTDGYHYNESGYEALAGAAANCILAEMQNK